MQNLYNKIHESLIVYNTKPARALSMYLKNKKQ